MVRNIGFTLASQLVGTVAGVAVGIVFARMLGPAGKGQTTYTIMILELTATFFSGPMAAVMSQYAREKLSRNRVYAAALRTTGVLAFPVVAVLLALALVVPSQRLLIATAVTLPCALYGLVAKTFLVAEGHIRSANIVDIVAMVGYAVVASAIVFAGGGVLGALAGWSLAYAASASVALWFFKRGTPREDATGDGDVAALSRRQMIFGGKASVVTATGYLNGRIDALVIATVLGPAALGIYSVALSGAEMLWKISSSITTPALGRIAGDSDEESRALVGRLIRTIIVIEIAAGAVVALAGPFLITLAYGERFAPAALPLRILIVGVVAYAIESVLGNYLLVRMRWPLLMLVIQGSSAVVCGIATYFLIGPFGLAGAAFATSITYVGVVVVQLCLVARSLKAPVTELFVPSLGDIVQIARVVRSAASHFVPARATITR